MDGNELITPVRKLGMGQCRHCGGPLSVLRSESVEMNLNSSGYPVKSETVYDKSTAFCPQCKIAFPMIETNMGFIPDSEISKIRLEKAQKIEVKNKETNPFSKENKDGV